MLKKSLLQVSPQFSAKSQKKSPTNFQSLVSNQQAHKKKQL